MSFFKEGTVRDKNRNNKRTVGVIHGNGEKKKVRTAKTKQLYRQTRMKYKRK